MTELTPEEHEVRMPLTDGDIAAIRHADDVLNRIKTTFLLSACISCGKLTATISDGMPVVCMECHDKETPDDG